VERAACVQRFLIRASTPARTLPTLGASLTAGVRHKRAILRKEGREVKHYCCSVSVVGGLWASWMLYSGRMGTNPTRRPRNGVPYYSAAMGVALVMTDRRRQWELMRVWYM